MMPSQELLRALARIEEQARLAISESPRLSIDRLRLILGFAASLRSRLTLTSTNRSSRNQDSET
jgi:hypothetical protein